MQNIHQEHGGIKIGDKVVYLGTDGTYFGDIDEVEGFTKDWKGVDQVILKHSDGTKFSYYFINFRLAKPDEIEANKRIHYLKPSLEAFFLTHFLGFPKSKSYTRLFKLR